MPNCSDCGKPMRKDPLALAWVHEDSGSIYCAPGAEPLVEPQVSPRRKKRAAVPVVEPSAPANGNAGEIPPEVPTPRRRKPYKSGFPIALRKHAGSKIVKVAVYTPHGKKWVSTGQYTYDGARKVCDAAMVEQLQMAACANALTADVISRLTTGRRFTCADVLEGWKAEALIDLAPNTANAYGTTLAQWLEYAKCAREPLSAIQRLRLDSFVNEHGVTKLGTRRARLAAIRSFYAFASAAGYCVGNMAERIRVKKRDLMFQQLEPRRSSKATVPMTEAEFQTLMDSPKVKGFWRAAIPLAYWLGWRLRDVATLEWASLRNGALVTIYQKKTGRRLELNIDDPLLGGGALRRTLMEMVEMPQADPTYCFPKHNAQARCPTRRSSLSVYFQVLLRRHGILDRRFHSLRHACAMRLKDAGKSMEDIAAVLGHSNIASTQVYTDH